MDFFKKNRRIILFIILYATLLLLGFNIHSLLENGLNSDKSIFVGLSGLIAKSLLALGIFWELYLAKKAK
ncbi:MAG: hypothetical protein KAJ23_03055 [Maribacter sp.]|nr:hypothetical protein [Maribacter sp.]